MFYACFTNIFSSNNVLKKKSLTILHITLQYIVEDENNFYEVLLLNIQKAQWFVNEMRMSSSKYHHLTNLTLSHYKINFANTHLFQKFFIYPFKQIYENFFFWLTKQKSSEFICCCLNSMSFLRLWKKNRIFGPANLIK